MKKALILTFILLFVMGMSAFATETRVLTMGQNNMILLDDANIFLFPSRVLEYPNMAFAEFGTPTYFISKDAASTDSPEFQRLGMHWQFNQDNPWVLATYFHNWTVYAPMITIPTGEDSPGGDSEVWAPPFWDGSLGFYETNRRIDLIYGRKFSSVNFGTHVGIIHSSWSEEIDPTDEKESYTQFNLKFGLTAPTGEWDAALGIKYFTFTDTYDDGTDEFKPSGNMMIHGKARYFKQMNPTYTLIPHGKFTFGKVGYEEYDTDGTLLETIEASTFKVDLGVGLQGTPATNVLAVLDMGIRMHNVKIEETDAITPANSGEEKFNSFYIPYFHLGIDADVFNWMDVRFGAVSNWDRFKFEEADYVYKENYASNETYLGFGFHWNRLHVDTYVDPELFLRGFNFISGEDQDGGYMNWQISTVLELGK